MVTSAVPHQRTSRLVVLPRAAAGVDRWRVALTAWDSLTLLACMALMQGGQEAVGRWLSGEAWVAGLLTVGVAAAAPALIALAGGYDRRKRSYGSRLHYAGVMILVATFFLWVGLLLSLASSRALEVGPLTAASIGLPLAWLGVRPVVGRLVSRRPSRVLVIGSGKVAQRLYDLSNRHPQEDVHVVGFLDDDPLPGTTGWPPVLGGVNDLVEVLATHRVDRVIVAFTRVPDEEVMRVLRGCDAFGVKVHVVPRLFDLAVAGHRGADFCGLPLVDASRSGAGRVQRALKRTVDLVGATSLLVLISPLLLAVAAWIKLDDRGPVFYRQQRVGRGGRPFWILKFRTMSQGADQKGNDWIEALSTGGTDIAAVVANVKSGTTSEITRAGRILRPTSIDELPQLWNVVKGEMSLVGPRPLRDFEVEALEVWQSTRHDVRPGITGLWQVLGRSDILWDERMQLDYSYVRSWSLATDLEILAGTLPAVVSQRGAV